MAAVESQIHDAPEILSLPPAATPSSPLDNDHERHIPPLAASRGEFYAPNQHRIQNQNQNPSQTSLLHQPLIHSRNPFSDTADSASIAPSVATTTNPPDYTSATTTRRYGHRSEEEYLAALRAWAEEKQYVQLDKNGGLHGFYGHEELKDRADRMTKERKVEKEMKARMKAQRRGTVAAAAGPGAAAEGGAQVSGAGGGRRRGSVANFFRRQSNAV